MRILMLAQFYPPIIGGEERHVRNLSAALVARGHDVAVATLWHEGMAEIEIDDGGVRIYRIRGTLQRVEGLFSETGRKHAPPFPDPELMWALRGVIKREQPDIVHAHNWMVHSFQPIKRWSGAALVMTLHDYSLACAQKRLMYKDVTLCSGPEVKKCLTCATAHYGLVKGGPTVVGNWAMGLHKRAAVDMFLPVSEAVAVGNNLVGSTVPYQVIPNFVPDNVGAVGSGSEPELAQLPDRPFMLFVGDLSLDKGVDVLFRAYAGLTDAPPLVLIGRVCADTPTDIPPNVQLLHSWPHNAIMSAWRRSLVGLTPSVCPDACPTVVMEAMATGCPVIGSRIGGLPDLVADGATGFLVPPGDVEALRQAMQRLLDDPALGERMGQRAEERVVAFQARTVVPRIEQIYERVRPGGMRQSRPLGTRRVAAAIHEVEETR
jgi:glycosyltransferase involved in cell wall biosynthesis